MLRAPCMTYSRQRIPRQMGILRPPPMYGKQIKTQHCQSHYETEPNRTEEPRAIFTSPGCGGVAICWPINTNLQTGLASSVASATRPKPRSLPTHLRCWHSKADTQSETIHQPCYPRTRARWTYLSDRLRSASVQQVFLQNPWETNRPNNAKLGSVQSYANK